MSVSFAPVAGRPLAALATLLLLAASIDARAQDAAPADDLGAALTGGTASIEERVRYEHVDQDGVLKDANALTARTRVGYTTGTWADHAIGISLENVGDLSDDAYNSGRNGHTEYARVADPTGSTVSDFFVKYTGIACLVVKAGRQHITLDNQRWIGDAGWRQKEIVYDAVMAAFSHPSGIRANYGYLWRASLTDFSAVSLEGYLLNAGWQPVPAFGATVYGYQFNFADDTIAARRDQRTYGLRLAGSIPAGDAAFSYALEGAKQKGYAAAPANVDAPYGLAELGFKIGGFSAKGGYEVRGSSDDLTSPYAIQTPFASAHAFGGWADIFAAVPASGLRDGYIGIGYAVGGVDFSVIGHDQRADLEGTANGTHYGQEFDVQLVRPFGKLAVLVGGALYDAKQFGVDTRKGWVQARYAF
jgi:hypothetical protein